MGWGTSKVMGVWVVFHIVALGLIEVFRYWSQVRACGSFWSSVFRAPKWIYGLGCQVEVQSCGVWVWAMFGH